jgi:CDP-glucose 4,6-dehydratase
MKKKYNILITGSSGLLGFSMIKQFCLSSKIKKIICVDKKKINILKIKNKKIKYFFFNISNTSKLKKILIREKIDIVFHTAAITQVTEAFKNPKLTYETNVQATTNFLEIIRELNKNIIFIYSSSDKAYGKLKPRHTYLETDKLIGDFTYDASKSASDIIAQSYAKTYKLNVGILRCGNIFGPGDLNFDRLFPGLFLSILKNERLKLRSSGKNIRDYLYVEDVVSAYYKLFLKMIKSKNKNLFVYNIGSKYNFSVKKICDKILFTLKINDLKPIVINNSKIEIFYQKLNFSKAKKELKWNTKTKLDHSIKKSFEWYKSNFNYIKIIN